MGMSTIKTEQFLEVSGGSLTVLSPQDGTPIGPGVPVGAEGCVVGRGSHCHLVLNDARVSTSHCEFVATHQGVRLTDLGSTNGTFVHQARLETGHAIYLQADTRVRCGQTWLAFRCAGQDQVPVSTARAYGPLVGGSLAMRRIYAQLAKIALHELNVLVTGETGTGKELVAQAIHAASRRREGPFITVDCTTIPAALAESMLFGHEKGAFTGAIGRHVSPFIAAQGGTIFFDELGELPLEIQPKLLRALEARQIQSVGSTRYQPIDVRVIAATRRNLHAEMNLKRFRDDLYFRFSQVIVEVPPLRARPEDIHDIAAHILAAQGDAAAIRRIEKPVLDQLTRHEWPGNVRELRNVVLAAHAQSAGGPIEVAEFLRSRRGAADSGEPTAARGAFAVLRRETLDALEREYFGRLLRETNGNLSEIARKSGLSRSTVREYLERHGLRASE
jgi:DNA-binding NtrC family response regulator